MASIPDAIGKYRVIRHLGDGGMGAVFLGHDAAIDREVAIKLVRADDQALRRRFQSEAQSAGRLKHANIVTVYEYGEFEGGPYIAMEYIEGSTISQLVDRGQPHSVSERLALLIQACQGLAYAHRAGVTHRDIKPSNLMVDREGVVKIVDFGIARTSGRDLTVTGRVVGTPAYMAPEQIQGAETDHRSDIFSMGIVVFEFLSGQVAFPGDSDFAVINRIVSGAPNTFSHPDAQLRQLIQPVIAKALARDPEERYQSAIGLAADLGKVRAKLDPASSGMTIDLSAEPTKVLPPAPTSRTPLNAASALVLTVIALGAWVLWPRTLPLTTPVEQPPAQGPASLAPPPPAAPSDRADSTKPASGPAASPSSSSVATATPEAKAVAPPQSAPRSAAATSLVESDRIRTRLAAARAAEAAGDFDAAAIAYQALLEEQPNNTTIAESLASNRRSQARARAAAVKSQLTEAEQKLDDGAYDEAIAIFEAVLKLDAENLEAQSGIGRARKSKSAEEALFKSRTKKPSGRE
ncbi:MAG: protein kinase domain-containing protein [Acidimicrobiia bacterium]